MSGDDRLRPWSARGAMVMAGVGLLGVGLAVLPIKTFPQILMFAGLTVSAVLIWTRSLGAQLLARAAWWGAMLFGALGLFLSVVATGVVAPEHRVVVPLLERLMTLAPMGAVTFGGLIALLGAGKRGLSAPSARFDPREGRGPLLASLVLGLSDASTLTFVSVILAFKEPGLATIQGLAALTMFVALWGLYRMRVWGLVAVMVANILIAGLAATGVLGSGLVVASPLFILTAVAQLFLPQRLFKMIRDAQAATASPVAQAAPSGGQEVMLDFGAEAEDAQALTSQEVSARP